MAKIETKPMARRKPLLESLPFDKTNYRILGLGLLSIALGYFALSQPPWDSTMAIVVAPILLVLGYCVLVPLGILYRRKSTTDATQPSVTKS